MIALHETIPAFYPFPSLAGFPLQHFDLDLNPYRQSELSLRFLVVNPVSEVCFALYEEHTEVEHNFC